MSTVNIFRASHSQPSVKRRNRTENKRCEKKKSSRRSSKMPPKEKKDKESSKAKDDKLKGKGKAKDRGEATNEDLVQDALAAANGRPVISSGQDASASQSVGAYSKGGRWILC